MDFDTLDAIHIRGLLARGILGINPEERTTKQDIIVNLSLYADLRAPGGSDRIEDTVNYKTLKDEVLALVEGTEFFLIERLAEEIAALCLRHERVAAVRACVEKPSALRFARSVGVEIYRKRAE
jgi:D-erythro-7,8-dihydroneopterin triphosphate epimerase